jgi:hypothetical protein
MLAEVYSLATADIASDSGMSHAGPFRLAAFQFNFLRL